MASQVTFLASAAFIMDLLCTKEILCSDDKNVLLNFFSGMNYFLLLKAVYFFYVVV